MTNWNNELLALLNTFTKKTVFFIFFIFKEFTLVFAKIFFYFIIIFFNTITSNYLFYIIFNKIFIFYLIFYYCLSIFFCWFPFVREKKINEKKY